ncbi:ribosome biogenesis factor YjgA [Dyella sp. BiH032]|uniref:ribosome biogenesis factor YjgA n=1 Tax=Dyella sp. BiH032 TaxID=3075430 RepID=UPI002892BFDF|nr:ribosome biogenesis factor YjgA [Dyella sp. BiH032]WNL47384.1 ribosome biogenesis factor YjgA [Dyella sp. BiH032]
MNRTYTDDPDHDYGPTRSQQRRDALAVLELAGQLVELPPSRLAKLDLPEDVVREIENTRKITSHIARKRQLGFLAKVMRRHDNEAFDSVRAALGENRERQRQETAAMHRLEATRERLLADEENALPELIAAYPQLDRQHLRSLLRQARLEREKNKPPRAYREIFQVLKSLSETDEAGGEDAGDAEA